MDTCSGREIAGWPEMSNGMANDAMPATPGWRPPPNGRPRACPSSGGTIAIVGDSDDVDRRRGLGDAAAPPGQDVEVLDVLGRRHRPAPLQGHGGQRLEIGGLGPDQRPPTGRCRGRPTPRSPRPSTPGPSSSCMVRGVERLHRVTELLQQARPPRWPRPRHCGVDRDAVVACRASARRAGRASPVRRPRRATGATGTAPRRGRPAWVRRWHRAPRPNHERCG